MLRVQIVRSALFLLASAPAILLWTGSRRGLMAALGWAYTATVGSAHTATAASTAA